VADQTATVQTNIVNEASRSTIHPESCHDTSGTPRFVHPTRLQPEYNLQRSTMPRSGFIETKSTGKLKFETIFLLDFDFLMELFVMSQTDLSVTAELTTNIVEYFSELPDPRSRVNRLHLLGM